jgi:phage terminase Nu1 subunit (DNA packaging protein)
VARARETELRTARQELELVPTEEAVAYVQMVVGTLVSRLNGLPAQFTRDLDERRRLEAAIERIRADVADAMAQHGSAYRSLPDQPV